jgi:hypothetical protein
MSLIPRLMLWGLENGLNIDPQQDSSSPGW